MAQCPLPSVSQKAYWVIVSPSASDTVKRLEAAAKLWPRLACMLDADVTGALSARAVISVPVPASALTPNRTPGV